VANGTVFVRADLQDGGSFARLIDAFAIVPARIYATNGGNGDTVYVQGDHFPSSTNGVAVVTDEDQANEVASVNFTTDANGTLSTSSVVPVWRCGDRIAVTATVGTQRATYRTLLECQI
jgi:hypothetical protein